MKSNKKTAVKKPVMVRTHEGALTMPVPNPGLALRRAVMSCFLFEDQFYESGMSIGDRIKQLVPQVPPEVALFYAIKARTEMKLRHAPLLLVREMARATPKHRERVAYALSQVIQRADELAEFLALYWSDNGGRKTLSAQVKKGLARAFTKFDEQALSKYNRDADVKLRDVLFLSHAKPEDAPLRRYTKAEREAERKGELVRRAPMVPTEKLFKALVEDNLKTADTWEVEFSTMEDKSPQAKKEAWEARLRDNKLGALALLRNLRNMTQVMVDTDLIKQGIADLQVDRVLPHRFIAAARAVPQLEHLLEPKMLECAATLTKLKGKTAFLIDVSSSMDAALSQKSDMTRLNAACGLAMIGREICAEAEVYSFSNGLMQVPTARRGFALRDAIDHSQPHGGTYLGQAVVSLNKRSQYDRIICITDEQSADVVPPPRSGALGYMINVASYENGVGYGAWNKIDGFSESVMRYIAEFESEQ